MWGPFCRPRTLGERLPRATKSSAHFQFIQPDSAEGKEIGDILIKYRPSDETHPYKPKCVCEEASHRSGKIHLSQSHAGLALIQGEAAAKSKMPKKTSKEHCIYNKAHNDCTYSKKWIYFIVAEITDAKKRDDLRQFKL